MKAITLKKGQFSFNGLQVVRISVGQIFEGGEAAKLISKGWAEECDDELDAESAAELARAQEAGKLNAAKEAERAEEARIKELDEKTQQDIDVADALARQQREIDDAAAMSEAQQLVDEMEAKKDKTPTAKGKGKK